MPKRRGQRYHMSIHRARIKALGNRRTKDKIQALKNEINPNDKLVKKCDQLVNDWKENKALNKLVREKTIQEARKEGLIIIGYKHKRVATFGDSIKRQGGIKALMQGKKITIG